MYDETVTDILFTDECEYNDKGLCIKYTHVDLDYPNTKCVYEYTYDKHENEVGLHYVEYDGEEKNGEGWTVTEYTYDKYNRITKQIVKMSFDNVEWNVFEHYEYKYKQNVTIEKDFGSDDSLDSTTTYTYDKKGHLVNEKRDFVDQGGTGFVDWEKVYTIDKNGCATKIEHFIILSSERTLYEVTEITYLNNLWYRPLKETTAHYLAGKIDKYSTTESEYDTKNRIKLYKIYEGTEEGPTPSYDYYATYEY